jgi:hypothetical protein
MKGVGNKIGRVRGRVKCHVREQIYDQVGYFSEQVYWQVLNQVENPARRQVHFNVCKLIQEVVDEERRYQDMASPGASHAPSPGTNL